MLDKPTEQLSIIYMAFDKKLYDAYYSYKKRRIQSNQPYPSLNEYIKLKKNGEKNSLGYLKSEWNKPGTRIPLLWLNKYNDIKILNLREKELLNKLANKVSHKIRPGEIKKQLECVREAIEILKESVS